MERNRKQVSASALNLMVACPRCFWNHYRRGIRRPEGPRSTVPNGLDRLIKGCCLRSQERGELPPFLRGKVSGRLATLPGQLTHPDPMTGLTVVGRLDACLDENGIYRPLDHKTRGFPPQNLEVHPANQLQMDCYAMLLEGCGYPSDKRAVLAVYWPLDERFDPDVRVLIPFKVEVIHLKTDPSRVTPLLEYAAAILSMARPPDPGPECEFCRWGGKYVDVA